MKTQLSIARRLRRQAGVSIVTAIFLLVVLSALGAAIVTLSTTQHVGSALDLLGSRAYEAARSGAEYGLYRQAIDGACGSSSFTMPAPTMAPFTVSVQCVQNATTNMSSIGTLGAPDYQPPGHPLQTIITSTACNQPAGGVCPNPAPTSPDYVQRVVTVQF
ncbi:agglutinin biogenesis protein MshP [Pseudoduganella aquatica]|uniref:Agglutinin biogenesis protein MshP n=1 Tax=Pseudoduganella aquatica TaxID=2660641 RepID=A0A7X4HAX6_9BURK|nr:agglutinin biogenesis protein MshP [Pseudoduganella aquatica]MYN07896.1 agglutinin biogenesis protein MshP [Pseudoduganella aquatica]